MKHCLFKGNYTKITIIILFLLVVLSVIMGCSNPFTTNDNHNKEGSLYLDMNLSESETDLETFIRSYSKYKMKVMYEFYRVPLTHYVRISYNRILIEEKALTELLSNDLRVRRISSLPFWTLGEMTIYFSEEINKGSHEEFIQDYSKYDLRIMYHNKLVNRILISFDHEIIDELDLMIMLENDQRVKRTSFIRPFPFWTDWCISGNFFEHVTNAEIELFVKEWSELIIISTYYYEFKGHNVFFIEFDPDLFDDLELLNKINENIIVEWAELVHISTVD